MIEEISGSDETDDWAGHQIILYPTKVDFSGRRVDAIRVDHPSKNETKAPAETRKPAASDDDIAF
jgi:hypothetical protein